MFDLIREGRWEVEVDEKGRFLLPAKIRKEFGGEGTWAKEPEGLVVLYPTEAWRQKAIAARNPQRFRENWEPFDMKLDGQGRMTIPIHFREELGRKIILRSIRKYLKIRSIASEKQRATLKGGDKMEINGIPVDVAESLYNRFGLAAPVSQGQTHLHFELKERKLSEQEEDALILKVLPPGRMIPRYPPLRRRLLSQAT